MVARRVVPAVAAIGFLLYPAIIYFYIDRSPLVFLVALLALLGSARLATLRRLGRRTRAVGVATLVTFCAVALAASSPAVVKLYPVLISAIGLAYGVWTLLRPPSAIERLVAVTKPDERLDDRKRAYMRHVTQVWVGFFCLNGAAAAYTALGASTAVWAVYNGLVGYVLMGALFVGEYAVRTVFRRRHYPDPAGAR